MCCVCVTERQTDRQTERQTERQRERDRERETERLCGNILVCMQPSALCGSVSDLEEKDEKLQSTFKQLEMKNLEVQKFRTAAELAKVRQRV